MKESLPKATNIILALHFETGATASSAIIDIWIKNFIFFAFLVAENCGIEKVKLITVDSDVAVLSIYCQKKFNMTNMNL